MTAPHGDSTSGIGDLQALADAGVLSRLDQYQVQHLCRIAGEESPTVQLGLALASRAVRLGHVCADLSRICQDGLGGGADERTQPAALPQLSHWLKTLRASALVGESPDDGRPWVLDTAGRLYLHRYAEYQSALSTNLLRRVDRAPGWDLPTLRSGLTRLFPNADPDDKQRTACLIALLQNLSVISGGPGTGKTFTATRILALLAEQALHRGTAFSATLLAPTGKAAQRLGSSIQSGIPGLDVSADIAAMLPTEASTIHRALGYLPRTPTRFRHNADNPLHTDIVIVDEASMVDLALMCKLLDAVPDDARVILLGDKEQLASVEAGAILGDIFGGSRSTPYSDPFVKRLAPICASEEFPAGPTTEGIWDCRIHLDRSRRYQDGSGINALAQGVNTGNTTAVGEAFKQHRDAALYDLGIGHELPAELRRSVVKAYSGVRELTPEHRLDALDRYRGLCAHRSGRRGVIATNELIERSLMDAGILQGSDPFYDGRPIMITANDYRLDLYNGDIGIIVHGTDFKRPAAFFRGVAGAPLRQFAPASLPQHETAFAMTVHKSQGSEFDKVSLLLTDTVSPMLTRELLYTGITRAKLSVELFAPIAVINAAVRQRISRASGLAAALWGAPTH